MRTMLRWWVCDERGGSGGAGLESLARQDELRDTEGFVNDKVCRTGADISAC